MLLQSECFWYLLPRQTSEHLQPAVRLPAEVASRLGGRTNLPALRQRQLRPPADAEGQERVRRQPGGVCVRWVMHSLGVTPLHTHAHTL